MLHSYEAQLQGNQVVWLGTAPPPKAEPRRVVVVLEEPSDEVNSKSLSDIFQRARGSLGQGNRDALLAELAQSRQEWER